MSDLLSSHDMKLYTDFQGLHDLHRQTKTNTDAVKQEVAEQFESLLIQMLVKSMRQANDAFSSDNPLHSDETAFYQELYDKQLALSLSKVGFGVAEQIKHFLDQKNPTPTASESTDQDPQTLLNTYHANTIYPSNRVESAHSSEENSRDIMSANQPSDSETFDDEGKFVKTLWSSAKMAAELIGTDPKILLAQAALETNWGKQVIRHPQGESTHNLFNIKADHSWKDRVAFFDTLEQEKDTLVKQRSKFRSYDNYTESFLDYAHFIKGNERYKDAVQKAGSAEGFIDGLQKAKYATDEKYSEKIKTIYSSSRFNNLFDKLNLT